MRRVLTLGLAAATLAGCTLEPHYVRPTPAVPGAWPTGPAYPPASAAALPAVSYPDIFKDPHLQAIIAQALANGQDLRVAMANVEIAHAQYVVQRADLFPHINAGVGGTESEGRIATVNPNGTTTSQRKSERSYDASIGFSAFELDLFGRIRSLSHAAQDHYFGTEAGARAARLTLVGEVASAYLTYAADRSLLAISEDTVASATRTVQLTQAKLSGGVSPRTDLTQAETLLDQARSDRASRITQVAQDRNALELLVGAPVADADLPASIESVDGLLGEVPAGLDSHILLRRPDVVEAEYDLRAANAQIGAARAAFFPTLSLTALAGAASPALGALFSGGNSTWTMAANASVPIFAGGANVGGLALAKGQRNLAVAEYQQAIQTAFREVADALARRGTINDQLSAQNDLLSAATTSYNLSEARYREGIDPYLDTLDAQRTLYSARQTLAATRLIQASNLVALYQALGGDQLIDSLPPPKVGTAKR
ncbi:MAG: efflux transporter outer membrane subunit [Phenylobacterium sp.]|nr:MAG: efflux transporter outer membrane subunit [Phenylobacterium sp.]